MKEPVRTMIEDNKYTRVYGISNIYVYALIKKKNPTCLASSLTRELAKLIQEQYKANQAHHFNFIIKPHMEKIIPRREN